MTTPPDPPPVRHAASPSPPPASARGLVVVTGTDCDRPRAADGGYQVAEDLLNSKGIGEKATHMEMTTPIRERLAALEHEQWAHWTRHLLDHLTPENIVRWRRQIDTPYERLSESEKQSDREWADRVLELVGESTPPEERERGEEPDSLAWAR